MRLSWEVNQLVKAEAAHVPGVDEKRVALIKEIESMLTTNRLPGLAELCHA